MTLLLAFLVLGFVLAGSGLGWFTHPSFFIEIIIFIALSTIALYWFTTRKLNLQPDDFVKIYLGATVLRILFFGGFIFTLIVLDKLGAKENALLFLVCYFLFTALEVMVLYRQINARRP